MSDRLDDILKQALTPDETPDLQLNRKILIRVKETKEMKKRRKWVPGIVFSLALTLVAGSGVAYAAYRLLTPEQAVEKIGDRKLAQAFSGEEAVEINETQHFREYDVTLLGIASGERLAEYVTEKNGEILRNRTYIVTAVSRADGGSMPDQVSDAAYGEMPFFVSPLIEGCNPSQVNIITMDGVYTEFLQDDVLYRLTECENIEIFADRTVYLCVSDGSYYNENAYNYDEDTGEITRNEDYKGVNALFKLPLDPAGADPEAAEEYLAPLTAQKDASEENVYILGSKEADAFMEKITPENIDEYAERVEDSVQVFGADEDGISYIYTTEDGEGVGRYIERAREFPDGKPGMSERIGYFNDQGGVGSLKMVTLTLNEEGTVTAAVYIPKERN